jgi:hypothetical protein
MPPTRKPLEVNTVWVFWRAFLLIFLVLEWLLWQHIRQLPIRVPRHRLIVFLLAPRATRFSAFNAMLLAGCVTLLAALAVQLILRPLLNLWLKPSVEPSRWLFHLSAGETVVASVPGRLRADGRWQSGEIVLTNRRIWFLPAAWDVEPWTLERKQLARIETEPPPLARLAAIQNWPELLRVAASTGEHARFAVADPEVVLAWFTPNLRRDDVASPQRIAPQGAFDA